MTDEKIIDMGTKKPFELVTGGDGTSVPQVKALLQRFMKYAEEREFLAIGVVMVDKDHSTITGYHMEEKMGTTLVGGASHLAYRVNLFMDRDDK